MFFVLFLKSQKYYSISVNSKYLTHWSTDIYCSVYSRMWNCECFIKFIPIFSHGAKNLADDFDYQTAVVSCMTMTQMSGHYTRLQAWTHQVNYIYIPCAGHSRNLVEVKSGRVLSTDYKILLLCSASVYPFLCLYTLMECSGIIFRIKYLVKHLTWDSHHIWMLHSRKLNMCWILSRHWKRKWTWDKRQKDWARKWRTWKWSSSQFFGMTFLKE